MLSDTFIVYYGKSTFAFPGLDLGGVKVYHNGKYLDTKVILRLLCVPNSSPEQKQA
jgi:hypothetical protein